MTPEQATEIVKKWFAERTAALHEALGMTSAEIAEIRTYKLRRVVTGWAAGGVGHYLRIVDADDVRDRLLNEIERLQGLVRITPPSRYDALIRGVDLP